MKSGYCGVCRTFYYQWINLTIIVRSTIKALVLVYELFLDFFQLQKTMVIKTQNLPMIIEIWSYSYSDQNLKFFVFLWWFFSFPKNSEKNTTEKGNIGHFLDFKFWAVDLMAIIDLWPWTGAKNNNTKMSLLFITIKKERKIKGSPFFCGGAQNSRLVHSGFFWQILYWFQT